MKTVFISYSSSDEEIAHTICRALETAGLTCWIAPRNIDPGKNYAEEIVNGIDRSSAMTVLISRSSNQSEHVVREVERAVNKRIPVLPVLIEDTDLSKALEYFLATCQRLSATDRPFDASRKLIVEHVIKIVGGDEDGVEEDSLDDPSAPPTPGTDKFAAVKGYAQRHLPTTDAGKQLLDQYQQVHRERGVVAALPLVAEAISVEPDNLLFKVDYAAGLIGRGEDDDAELLLKAVLERDAEMGLAWNNLSNIYLTTGRYEQALDAAERAIEVAPESHQSWAAAAGAYYFSKMWNKCQDAAEKCLKRDFQNAFGLYYLGLASYALERYSKALKTMKMLKTLGALPSMTETIDKVIENAELLADTD